LEEPGAPEGVSTAVRLARLPDLETMLPMRLLGRLLFDMVLRSVFGEDL
jgi:hypothetical protein